MWLKYFAIATYVNLPIKLTINLLLANCTIEGLIIKAASGMSE